MVNIGYRPIISLRMKSYAHFGHTDFILCLGYRGDLIKQQVLDYNYLKEGQGLVREPFQRLIGIQQLTAYRPHGFWACLDPFEAEQAFDDLEARGDMPWHVSRLPQRGRRNA